MAGSVVEPKKLIGPQEPARNKDIREVFGEGRAGRVLLDISGDMEAVKIGNDSMVADFRTAVEKVEEAGKHVAAARGEVAQAKRLIADQGAQMGAFLEEQAATAREIAESANGAAAASRAAEAAASKAETAVLDATRLVDSITIKLGDKELKGAEALEAAHSIVVALADLSMAQGESKLTGTEALAHVIRSLADLKITRGQTTVGGLEVLGEVVNGIGSLTITRVIKRKVEAPQSDPVTEVGGTGFATPEERPLVAPVEQITTEKVSGLEALAYLCSQVDNLQDPVVMKSVVSGSLEELFSAKVEKQDGGSTKVVELKGVALLDHMLATLEQIQRDLPEGTRKAVNEMFTAKVIVGGEEQILSGAELVAYLVSEVDSAKRSAGSAVKDAEAAKQALGRAEAATSRAEETVGIARELVITIQGEFSGVQSSVAAAFEAVDKKIAALMMLVTSGRELTPQEAEHAQTILEPSYKPANAGEVKG